MLAGEQPDSEIEKYIIVDAINGKIIRSYTARFPNAEVKGTVLGEIYPSNPTDAISTMPLRHLSVEIEGIGTTTTNNSGSYAKHVLWWWMLLFLKHAKFKLEGPHAKVQNSN